MSASTTFLALGAAPPTVLGSNMADSNATKDASTVAAPAAAAAASSSSAAPAVVVPLLDLSAHRISSVCISRSNWTKDMPRTLAEKLLKVAAPDAMAVLVVHSDVDGRTLSNFLHELSASALKKLCKLLGLSVPATGSADVVGACIRIINHAVDAHTSKHSHLVNKDERFPWESDADADGRVSDEDSDAYPERKEDSSRKSPESPRKSPRSSRSHAPKPTAAASSSATAKSRGESDASSKKSILAALGGLPGAPNDGDGSDRRSGKKSSMRRGHTDSKSARSKHSKRDKKHSHRVLFSSDSDDSDSDGPSSRRAGTSDGSSSSSSSDDSSSGSSSTSDSDDESSRKHRRRKHKTAMEQNGLAKPLAGKFIRNALSSTNGRGSIVEVYKEMEFKVVRNQRECESLARIIDLLRAKKRRRALEACVRRLVGVQSADTSGNWRLCDQFELVMDKQSFVPDEFLARALKNAQRLESLETGSAGRRERGNAPSSRPAAKPKGGKGTRGSGGQHNTGGTGSGPTGNNGRGARDRSDSRGPPSNSSKGEKGSKDKRDA